MAWMAGACVAFAVMVVCARVASQGMPWAEVGLFRALTGAAVAAGVARWRGAALRAGSSLVWGRSLLGTSAMLCMFYVFSKPALPLGDVSTLRATSPLLIALLAWVFLKERTGRRLWVSLPMAFAGVLVMLRPTFEIGGHLAILVLGASALSAVAMLFLRRLKDQPSEAVALHFGLTSASVMALFTVLHPVTPKPEAMVFGLVAGLVGGVGQLMVTRAYALEPAGTVGTASYLSVVFVQVLALFVLGEVPTAAQISGAVLVVGAGVWLALPVPRTLRPVV